MKCSKLNYCFLTKDKVNSFKITKFNTKANSGFTLLELLIVLALMMIFIYGVTPHFNQSTDKIREEINETNIKLIEGSAQVYRLDTGSFPADVDSLIEEPQGISGWRGPYLDQWPQNPYDSLAGYELDTLGKVK